MKAIIIGTSASGKTTLVTYLRDHFKYTIGEIDEELMRVNNGEYPSDADYKHNVLVPKVVDYVLSLKEIIFFTNTDYFTAEDLKEAKEKGFKIIQLYADMEILKERNKYRVEELGWNDLSIYFEGMLAYQKEINDAGLVDDIISNNKRPIEEVALELCEKIGIKI